MSNQLLIYKHRHEETKWKKTKNVAEADWDPNNIKGYFYHAKASVM